MTHTTTPRYAEHPAFRQLPTAAALLDRQYAAQQLPTALVVDEQRDESDTCERGTSGCCVAHARCDHGCETW